MRLEQRESQRLQALAGNLGLQPWFKPPVRWVVMIDVQSDDNSFFEVFKVPKTKGVALDKFDEIISDFQFGVRIGQFKGIDNFLVIFEKCFKDSLKNQILCVFLILRFLPQSLLVFNAVNKVFTIV